MQNVRLPSNLREIHLCQEVMYTGLFMFKLKKLLSQIQYDLKSKESKNANGKRGQSMEIDKQDLSILTWL